MAGAWDVVEQTPAPAAPRPVNRTSPAAQGLAGAAAAPTRQSDPRAPQASAQAGARAEPAAGGWDVVSTQPAPPPREVGFFEGAGRTAASAATPTVRTLGMADAGLLTVVAQVADAADAIAPLFGIKSDLGARLRATRDERFQATDELAGSMRDMYAPKPGEEFGLGGQFAGAVASLPLEMAGGLGITRGVERAADVVQRGGTLGEAGTAGGITAGANLAANALPIKLGGGAGRLAERTLGGGRAAAVGAGAATGGMLGIGGDQAVVAAENASLPAGEAFTDLQGETNAAVSGGLGAALGGLAGALGAPQVRAPRRQKETKPTPGTQGSAGAAGTDKATERRARADNLPVPVDLTEGQATRSFEQQRFERETAKDPDAGAPLRERAADQNERVLKNFDALESETGATQSDAVATGKSIVDPIIKKAERAKAETNAAYDKAREAGEMEERVDATALATWINDNTASERNAGVIGTAKDELVRLGGAERLDDGRLAPLEISLNDLEELRKTIVAGGKKDATNAEFGRQIRQVIDRATEGAGGDLYRAARGKHVAYVKEFKEQGAIRDLIFLKRNSSDRRTAYEDVVRKTVLAGSLDDLSNVKRTLTTAGDDGAQAWRELQGAAIRHIRDEATKNVARDIRGNQIVSPAGLGKAIRQLDTDGKLEALFGKKGAETLRDLDDVAKDLFTAPPGAVNTSNTASVVLKELSKWGAETAATTVLGGVPLPVINLGRAIKRYRDTRKVEKQVEAALGPKREPGQQPAGRRFLETPAAPVKPAEPIPTGQAREIKPATGRAPLLARLPVPEVKELPRGKPATGRAPDLPELPVGDVRETADTPPTLPTGFARELDDAEFSTWSRDFGLGEQSVADTLRIDRALQQDADAVERAAVQHAKQPVAFARAIDRILEKQDETVTAASAESGQGLPGPRGSEEGGQQGQRVGQEGPDAAAQEEVDADPLRRAAAEQRKQEASAAARALASQRSVAPKAPEVDPESLVVNPIDRTASPAEKVRQLAALTEQNKPLVQKFLRELDAALGTKSGDSVKTNEKIGLKASRPAILQKKPWHDVEHIRDSYRFKTVLESLDQLPEVARRLNELGIEIVKADVDKVLRPKEFGWRIAAFDLRMPNGQLVEYYLPVKELEAAKKGGGHKFFEEARELDISDPAQLAKYEEIAARSRAFYDAAWEAYLARTGGSGSASRAALDSALAALSSTRSKPDMNISPVTLGAGDDQAPTRSRLADQPGAKTQASREPLSAIQAQKDGVSTRKIVAEMPVGRTTVTYTDRGDEVHVTYRLADVSDLVTSHDDALRVNPEFPAELQPRDRSRQSSEDQIAKIANAVKPELLGESIKASDGAPIVGADGVVESGNARTMGLRRAYANGNGEGYREWLLTNADKFGLKPEDVRRIKRPVLIREGLQPYDRAEFARRANESSVQQLSETEQAQVDAMRLPPLADLVVHEDGGIDFDASRQFVADFMRFSVAPAERNRFMTAEGSLSQSGAQRIRNAVFAKAYGNSDVVAMMSESLDPGVKNVLSGLLRAAPRVAEVREMQAAGARSGDDFAPDLVEAVRTYATLRKRGQKVEQFLSQGSLVDDGTKPRVAEFMRQLEADARAPRRIGEMVEGMVAKIDAEGDPRQATLMEPRAKYGKLADDLDEQQGFLEQRAKAAGYKTLDEFVAGDFAGFMRAAEDWREKNPAAELREPDLLSPQTAADLKAKTEREAAAVKAEAAEQKRLADKAKADAERPDFFLTGSNSKADQAEAAGQSSLFDREAPYETDLFGETISRPKKFKPLLAKREPKPNDTPAPEGEYFVRTVIGTPTKRRIGATKIVTAADAAAATAYLYRSPVERFDAIVTDAKGKPLGIVGGFKGDIGQTSVYPPTLIAEAVRIPGAARIWFSHNHPSGTAQLSRADEHIEDVLRKAFEGSGIEPMGLLAVAGKFYGFKRGSDFDGGEVPQARGDMEVDVVERELRDPGNRGETIDTPARAKDQATMFYSQSKRPGILFVDSQNKPAAWVPIPSVAEGKLMGTGGLRALYRATSEANAPSALVVHGGELDADLRYRQKVHANIANALRQAGVRVLDVINAKTGESHAERGTLPPQTAVYSIAALTAAGLAAGDDEREKD